MSRSVGRLVGVLATLWYVVATPPLVAQHCGVERWPIKTGTDADAQRVDLPNPKNATVAELTALPPPHPIPPSRPSSPPYPPLFTSNPPPTPSTLTRWSPATPVS